MSQQKQAPLPRQEFQEWLENAAVPVLVLQKGKHLGSVVKVPATPEIDYLFGCETFYGERISWSDRLEFCGLYDRQHQALHLLDDPLPNFVSGLTEEECQDSTAFGKRIAQEVDRYVEAAISNERSRLSVRELTSERNINSYRYYKGTEAGREAASLVFSGEKPDVQFHSEYYTSLTEDTLLSYLKSPEDYIKTTAEQYMRDNQEEFLAQFLKKDALLAEYPDNLKSKAVLWLWELRDIAIIGVGALISVFAMAQLGFLPPVVITAAYAFLSIRLEDTSILDFLRYAIRYFLLGQQTYAWGLCNPSTDRSDRK